MRAGDSVFMDVRFSVTASFILIVLGGGGMATFNMRNSLQSLGLAVIQKLSRFSPKSLPQDATDGDIDILNKISGYTMTSVDRQLTLINAVRYIVSSEISGCFVECGVWKGGSSMAVSLALLQEGQRDRDIFLYDTFEGMTAPTINDKTLDGIFAQQHLDRSTNKSGYWCVAGIEEVRLNMNSTGYPEEKIHLIKGPVEKTIPSKMPTDPIALLRLDTDWYESTQHELTHLFPRLVEGGIMIIDDYGHWKGARKAVDEYFEGQKGKYFLNRIDYTGRLIVKGLK